MTEAIFLKVLNLSITASWLVLAVMVFRIVFRKVPKAIHVFLWALVGIRLVCPFSFESMLSLIPSAETVPQDIVYAQTPAIHSGVAILNSTINPILQNNFAPEPWESVNPLQMVLFVFQNVWILGIIVMISYACISYWRVKHRVRESIPMGGNVYFCDKVKSPFILGVLHPHIYIPTNLQESESVYVIAHEKAHIKRLDHIWKPLGFFVLTVYWFQPLFWLAYVLLCRDIELACDEKVIDELGVESKKPYSMALLNCSVSRRNIAACPLAFGEVNVKNRIKSVLNYKKPGFWLIVIAVLISAGIVAAFLTDPVTTDVGKITQEKGYYILEQNEYEFTATIPKDVLTEEAFTNEGQTFKTDEVIVYSTDTTNIYLKHVMLSNESEEYLNLIFDFSYHDLDRNSLVLLPYVKSDKGYTFTIRLKSEDLADSMVIYDQVLSITGHGPEEQFAIGAYTEIVKNAWKYMSIKLVANELFYRQEVPASQASEEKMDKLLELFLNKTVMERFSTEHSEENYRFIDIEVLNIEKKAKEITVYAWVLYEEYSYNGEVLGECGAHIPVAIRVQQAGDFYELIEFWQPEDGNQYADSIRKKFPQELHRKALDSQRYIDKQMKKSEEAVNSFYATNISGKVYRGEEVVYGTRPIDSFVYTDKTMPVFVLEKANLHLLTNDFPEPSILSSYYDIGQIQKVELDASLLEYLLDDEFNPWKKGYSAEELYRENKNVYMVTETGQEYNRFYYVLEQKNGDVYIAFGWDGEGIRYVFKMYVSEKAVSIKNSSIIYVSRNEKQWDYATVTLNPDDGSFTFIQSPISSYLGYGKYSVEDNYLVLRTDDGTYTYKFEIIGEGYLSYNGKVYKKIES